MRLLLAALLAWPIATLATGLPSLRISGSARAAALAEAGVPGDPVNSVLPDMPHPERHALEPSFFAVTIPDIFQAHCTKAHAPKGPGASPPGDISALSPVGIELQLQLQPSRFFTPFYHSRKLRRSWGVVEDPLDVRC